MWLSWGFRLSQMRIALVLLAAAFAASPQAGPCVAKSGPNTAALVELYTCSRCPSANRWLSGLSARAQVPNKVVPVALHVDYRDYLGWKDPEARRDFPARQRKLTQLQRLALVYTPQVLLQGSGFRDWGTPEFDAALAKINARPARAQLGLEIRALEGDRLVVNVEAEILDAAQLKDAGVYLAAYEHRAENRVVLEWQGPLAFSGARLALEQALPLPPGARAADSGVVGFVQNRRTAEVLQALILPSCP
jgi:hypothetical protein